MKRIGAIPLIAAIILLSSCGYEELPELTYPTATEAEQTSGVATSEEVPPEETSLPSEETTAETTVAYTTAATDNPRAEAETNIGNNTAELINVGLDGERYSESLDRISALVTPYGDDVGFIYIDITTGNSLEYNADTRYPGASLVKAPFVKSILATNADLDREIISTEETLNSPSELLMGKPIGTAFTVREVIRQTIVASSNTGYNMLLDEFGYGYYNSLTWSLGLSSVLGDSWKYTGFTARQMGVYFKDIYYFTESGENGEFLKECMKNPIYNRIIGNALPDKEVAQKYGYMPEYDVNHNCAVVYGDTPYVICIMTGIEGSAGATNGFIEKLALEVDSLNSIR